VTPDLNELDLASVARGVRAIRLPGGEALAGPELASLRDGPRPPRLHLDITAYRQPAAPNRRFLRFLPENLPEFARSFVGQPFLRDHAQRNSAARGGTVLSSGLVYAADGPEMHQTVELVKAWAIEGALDGTIDRFSIGWDTTGEILCSVCEGPLWEGKCYHMPGDTIDGRRVEAIITGSDGVETSSVNVPAVVGTGVHAVRAAFAALAACRPKPIRVRSEEVPMSKLPALAAVVALADDADEDAVLAAVKKMAEDHDRLAACYDAEQKAHLETRARLDKVVAELGATRKAELERLRPALLEKLRAKVGLAVDGRKPKDGGTWFERQLDAELEKSPADAERFVEELPQIVPKGILSRAPVTPEGEAKRREEARSAGDQLGLSDEDYKKYAPRRG